MKIKSSKDRELIYDEINKSIIHTKDVISVEQYSDFLKLLGLNSICPNLTNVQPGDVFFNPKSDTPLHIITAKIGESDKYNDIMSTALPLHEILYPREMKKIYPTVMGTGYNIYTSRGSYNEDFYTRIRKVIKNPNDLPIKVDKSTIVQHNSHNVRYTTKLIDYNFINLTYFLVKKRKYIGMNDNDMTKYSRIVNVIIQKVWPTDNSTHYRLKVISVTGLGTHCEEFKNAIKVGFLQPANDGIVVDLVLKNEDGDDITFGDFTPNNSEIWLIAAHHNY